MLADPQIQMQGLEKLTKFPWISFLYNTVLDHITINNLIAVFLSSSWDKLRTH